MSAEVEMDQPSPIIREMDAWFRSGQGQRCADPNILCRTDDVDRLTRRLEDAYLAGAAAQSRLLLVIETENESK